MESSVAVLPDVLGLGVDVNWDPRDPEGGKDWWFVARVHRGERIVFRLVAIWESPMFSRMDITFSD